jgi:trimethylguanosine synthase
MMDFESWYSVTPEELATYTAKLCGSNAVIVDAFCGPGGNVIQVNYKLNN